VLDEANKRVLKFYVDIEVPVYYRANVWTSITANPLNLAPILRRISECAPSQPIR
jgi:hypothetical protein